MTPRDIVTQRIAGRASSFPNFDLTPLDTSGLDARDAALARAIDHAVARRWLTLATIVNSRLDQEWADLQPAVQAPLLVGAAQLLLLEKLPDHAVINEAVEWTKHSARRKAGGLVNAVLRRVADLRSDVVAIEDATSPLPQNVLPLEDGRALMLAEDVFDIDPLRRLAQQTSHSEALIGYWSSAHGTAETIRLAMHSLVHAPIIVTGVDPSISPHLQPHEQPGFFVYTGPRQELDGLLASSTHARVQDPGTAAAMLLSSALHPKRIVDVCAGRGTKTRQLASLHPDAHIITTDLDPVRHEALSQAFEGSDRVEVVEFAHLRDAVGTADLVVLDVPCSNTGVFARRVEAKYRFTGESLQTVRDMQRQIIADALTMLSPTGHLLYSTCSIEATENEQQVAWACRWHPLKLIEQRRQAPQGLPGGDPSRYYDGGFAALLAPA